MILVAGLTPAWQQIVMLKGFRHGEVNRAQDVHWCASGKVLNVGIALKYLGAEAETLALVGGPPLAGIEAEFSQLGIRRRWINSEAATRVCSTILETDTGVATELVENAGEVTAEELKAFATAFREEVQNADIVVLTGSLAAGTPETFYCDLMTDINARMIIDGRGAELTAALSARPFLVKPNREELGRTMGRQPETDAELIAAMRELNAAGAEWVLVTQGADAVWLTSTSDCYRFQPPKIEPVNPIGSGDCLAAGIAWALDRGEETPQAVKIGIAAGVENALRLLPGRIGEQAVLERAESVTVETV